MTAVNTYLLFFADRCVPRLDFLLVCRHLFLEHLYLPVQVRFFFLQSSHLSRNNTTQHSTVQYSTAQHSTAERKVEARQVKLSTIVEVERSGQVRSGRIRTDVQSREHLGT
jgi:hypothetical protein